jgi:hypothetical protein
LSPVLVMAVLISFISWGLRRIVLVLEFSGETGQIEAVREYLDTALAWEVKDKHGVY